MMLVDGWVIYGGPEISSFQLLLRHAGDDDTGEHVKGPAGVVYRIKNDSSIISQIFSSDNTIADDAENAEKGDNELEGNGTNSGIERRNQRTTKMVSSGSKRQPRQMSKEGEPSRPLQSWRGIDNKVRQMKDQLVMAKAYLNFALAEGNSHLVKELRLRIREVEHAAGETTKDSDLSRRALQRSRSMESTLTKASRFYSDCSAMVTKLRAMNHNAEEQVRAQKNQATFLVQLAARTFPKGLHCLSMQLTVDYYSLRPKEREFPNRQKLQQQDLYHYAIFSDNVLACAVVVNSTVSTSKSLTYSIHAVALLNCNCHAWAARSVDWNLESTGFPTKDFIPVLQEPQKIVFHVITDALNLQSISMWFLENPPGKATIEVLGMESFKWLPPNFDSMLMQTNSVDPRFTSKLNHLRFYLPSIFPALDKVVLLDHDVVVQKDLRGLWRVGLKRKVNGAVETRGHSKSSNRMDMFINFSDPEIAKRFNAKVCTWAFGVNVFDLHEWRRQDLTTLYHKLLQLENRITLVKLMIKNWDLDIPSDGQGRQLWKAGSLPLGLLTFYNNTGVLEQHWHLLGLGYESGVGRGEIDKAAVIHYDGNMKPWLDSAIPKYRGYWSKFLKYENPYLQRCNIHE
ncbi:hypothetical protein ACLOJK_032839 [Asimina triloba]